MITIPARDMFLQRSDSDFRGDREKSASQMRREVAELTVEIQRAQREINKLALAELAGVLDTTFNLPPAITSDTLGLTGEMSGRKRTYLREPLSWRVFNLRVGDGTNDSLAAVASVKTGAASIASLQSAQRLALNSIDSHLGSIRSYRHSMNSLLVEIHKKYSISVACIVFVLIGAPLGVLTRQSGMAVSGGMSLGFFLLYWSFLIAGEDLADRQMLSPLLAMWLANLIVGGFGIYVLIAVANERPFFDFTRIGQAAARLFRSRSRTIDHASS
jgi:lipopolysaccharide export system permease protein